ncbi:OsmC family protein [Biformimicrobium ophioploci]|uniref:Organic hydroperoxide resistance protein n=1 Tax=Biformimicrobium ophioploci TaxID=3036711 RepID=A0ABQ6LZP2_9GAMM|nr:OsmC family protein [Microbulbifer sp. NKW57]GMG87546.1 organic hydroperoxide resistance protein [Microbulbifer sp. NKW57]
MQAFPHHYKVNASARQEGAITVSADGLPDIESGPPASFGGSGDVWSPEDFFVAAAADCLILTFRALARMKKFEWVAFDCQGDGVLDKTDEGLKFTELHLRAKLTVPAGTDPAQAEELVLKAKKGCLVTKSMATEIFLTCEIETAG